MGCQLLLGQIRHLFSTILNENEWPHDAVERHEARDDAMVG